MPFLESRLWGRSPAVDSRLPTEQPSAPLFPECSNPWCRSGRIHLWRSRRIPLIEGGWVCSPECTLRRMQSLIAREMRGHSNTAEKHAHRVPLGLILLAQGWISRDQLKRAIQARRDGYTGRIGEWLMEHCHLEEHRITQGLSLQWNCPVFSAELDRSLLAQPPIPRILMDAFGLVPLRLATSGALLLAFEDRIDHSLTLAVERMLGQNVEAGLLDSSQFRLAHRRMLAARFPRARLIEGGSPEALSQVFSAAVENAQPSDVWMARVHQLLWVRLWTEPRTPLTGRDSSGKAPFEDIVCSLAEIE